jgi:regulator of cell morphogenesis and NO signaling
MAIDSGRSVRELATEYPATTRVLESFGIDYCCGGGQSLEAACKAANLPLAQVLESVESAIQAGPRSGDPDWGRVPLAVLADHIVSVHHAYVKSETPRLQRLLAKVVGVHGSRHPELGQIQEVFSDAAQELALHMMKEEQMLFPYIATMEKAVHEQKPLVPPRFGSVRNPIQMMMMEHDSAGEDLRQIRELSQNYTAPPDACVSFQSLYAALKEFESDLHQHVHLENNILFPRAVDLEQEALAR